MNSVFLPSSLLFHPPALHQSALFLHIRPRPRPRPRPQYNCCCYRDYSNGQQRLYSPSFLSPVISCHYRQSSTATGAAAAPSNEGGGGGAIPVMNFEDFVEKDWSFLDTIDTNSDEYKRRINRIVSAGEIQETSRVLVSIGSEQLVDQILDSSPCQLLLLVHDSLLVLACIKEKYDMVKCWQGELIYVPEKWSPFDVVFLYYLPGLPFKLDQLLGALAKHCLPGARIVISHPQGREVLEQQRRQFPDVVISYLPDEMALQRVAADHSFQLIEFVDEPGFYLVVLKFKENDLEK